MPYFDPTPGSTQWFYWIRPNGQDPLISSWPKPGAARSDTRFRLPVLTPGIWTAGRWWNELDIRSGPMEELLRGWLDLEAVDVNHLFGSAGISASGIECTLDIQGYESIEIFGWPGIIAICRWQTAGAVDFVQEKYWFALDGFSQWKLSQTLIPEAAFFHERTTAGDLNPPTIIGTQQGSLSDCYDFPLLEPEEGFCACNGVDSWILFDGRWPETVAPFRMVFRIRPHESGVQLVCFGASWFGSFGYMFNGLDNFQWWNNSLALPDGLVLDEWNLFRIEYDWSIPGAAYTVWIDDVLQITKLAGNRQFSGNQIGKRGSLLSGHFDIKQVKYEHGTPASPVSIVEIPLDIDACCVTPVGVKGETFNMDLSSCP